MDNKELAEKITGDVMVALNACNVMFNWHDYRVSELRNRIEEAVLENLNAHYQTQSVPAAQSLPTTCDEPGIAY